MNLVPNAIVHQCGIVTLYTSGHPVAHQDLKGCYRSQRNQSLIFLRTVSIFQLLHEADPCYHSFIQNLMIHILAHVVQLYFLRKLHPSVNLRQKNMSKATWAIILFQRAWAKLQACIGCVCPPGPAASGLAEDRGAARAEHHRLGRAEHSRDPSTQTLIID